MKCFKPILFTMMLFVSMINCRSQSTPLTDATWSLMTTVSDEFNSGALDGSKWSIGDWRHLAFSRCDGTTGTIVSQDMRAVRTTTDISFSSVGSLSYACINTQSVNYPAVTLDTYTSTPCTPSVPTSSTGTRPYTSLGYLRSLTWFRYGYFEMKCLFPQLNSSGANSTNTGLGANFWLSYDNVDKDGNGVPVGSPTCSAGMMYSEIDIFEILGTGSITAANAKHEWGVNSHYYQVNGCAFTNTVRPCSNNPPCPYAPDNAGDPGGLNCPAIPSDGNWHTYAASWQPDKIEYFFDGNLIYTSYNYPQLMDPLRIMIDVNVFKGLNGDPALYGTYDPYLYKIDYVRVYNRNTSDRSNCFQNNLSSINPSVYQCIKLGGIYSAVVSTGSALKEKYLSATDYIELNDGFEVSSGATFEVNVNTSLYDSGTKTY